MNKSKCQAITDTLMLLYLTTPIYCAGSQRLLDHHPCLRECGNKTVPMVCYYNFEVEMYYTMSKACYDCPYNLTDCYRPDCVPADGVERMITVVNRQLPGPSIQVCLGDLIIVDVSNMMLQESTTIHWHGHHQRNTQYMDGVPFVTQCPIPPNNSFRYKYGANTPGTHFWHSHTGCQRTDGVYGALIIRKPYVDEAHSSLYDFDLPNHTIQIHDWIHEPSMIKMMSHFHNGGNNKPNSILVNGKGRYHTFIDDKKNIFHTPLQTFTVQKGKRYRFRIINSGFLNCPVQLSFENHSMIIISSDGSDIQPVYVKSLVSYAGERWDIILKADQAVDNYWIGFKGLLDCSEQFNSVFATAVLHYENANNTLPESIISYKNATQPGLQLNALNKGSGEFDFASVAEISDIVDRISDPELKLYPDVSLTLGFDFYPLDNPMFHKHNIYGFNQVKPSERIYTPQINHISLTMPTVPILSQPEDIRTSTLCNATTKEDNNCTKTYCRCTYIINIPLNSTVEITLVDIGEVYDANHPFHLHGYSFRVIALEKLGNSTSIDEVKSLDRSGLIFRNLRNPPIKDTVTVPDGGFTIIRFFASNPGYWLLHCHLDYHVEIGMSVIFKIGEEKYFPPIPENFPKCGNYQFTDKNTEGDKLNEIDLNNLSEHGEYYYNSTSSVNNDKNDLWNILNSLKNTISFQHNNSVSINIEYNTYVLRMVSIIAFLKYLYV